MGSGCGTGEDEGGGLMRGGTGWGVGNDEGLRYTATDTWEVGAVAVVSLKRDDLDEAQLCLLLVEQLGVELYFL